MITWVEEIDDAGGYVSNEDFQEDELEAKEITEQLIAQKYLLTEGF